MGEIKLDKPTYEKIVIWAEESTGLNNNSPQWSFGNGATGNNGVVLVEDWEIYGFSFHADNSSAGSSVSIDIMDYANGATVLTSIQTTNQGQTNNYVYAGEVTPVAVPQGTVIGFRTKTENGTISDARACVWLRKLS